MIAKEKERLENTIIKPTEEVNQLMEKYGTSELTGGVQSFRIIEKNRTYI